MSASVRARQFEPVDLICWNHYGITDQVVELAIEANPGICEPGPFVTEGLLVLLPDAPEPRVQEINLWD